MNRGNSIAGSTQPVRSLGIQHPMQFKECADTLATSELSISQTPRNALGSRPGTLSRARVGSQFRYWRA